MLSPKRVKYRKPHKGNMRGMANSGNYVCYGSYGMKAIEPGWLTNRQIEAGRVALSKRVRKVPIVSEYEENKKKEKLVEKDSQSELDTPNQKSSSATDKISE